MNQCERCGATNQAASRFCVACGAPLIVPVAAPMAVPSPVPAGPPQYPSQPSAHPYPAQPQAPGWPQAGYGTPGTAPPPAPMGPQVVVSPYEGPPSSNLPFSETAGPGARQSPIATANPYTSPSAPAPQGFQGSWGHQGATAAMPGVTQDPAELPEGAPRILAGFLVSYEADALGRFWPIYQGRSAVGREGAAPNLDIAINHPTTSSRHAVLLSTARPGRIQVEDGGSTNGTFVNDTRIVAGHRVELRDGDRIRFGLFTAIVKIV